MMAEDQDKRTVPAGPAERRIAELENEVLELTYANRILMSVATYFANSDAPARENRDDGGLAPDSSEER
ncbi:MULTISPECIES: hypothetical protein [unclassified Streptomyces]|uniref:hypothetical protein n=1 Tax=unclassified Streptomyces TaxID=2593676 RepID=UPI001907E91D|nr:hypothetical protein [Streptomyces sp. HSG2]